MAQEVSLWSQVLSQPSVLVDETALGGSQGPQSLLVEKDTFLRCLCYLWGFVSLTCLILSLCLSFIGSYILLRTVKIKRALMRAVWPWKTLKSLCDQQTHTHISGTSGLLLEEE